MNFIGQWNAIAGLIRGLASAAQLHANFLKVRDSDSYNRGGYLAKQCRDALLAIEGFAARFRQSLPPAAAAAIDEFVQSRRALFAEAADGADARDERSRAALVLLVALESQISFLLSDVQAVLHTRSEQGFAHLQRSIAADPDIQKKWRRAFASGEVACEKLGAAHLLFFGIWAFKAQSPRAITDLVFQDIKVDDAPGFASGLVLTEWKAAKAKAVEEAFVRALEQAKLYAPGALSGNELTGYRYLVVVTDGPPAAVPDDIDVSGVRYRHVLISVSPTNVSTQAAKAPRKEK
jgi:hypothetical protein